MNCNHKPLKGLMIRSSFFLLFFLTSLLLGQTNAQTNSTLSSNINFRLKTKTLKFPFVLKFKSYLSDPVQLNIVDTPITNKSVIKKVKIKKIQKDKKIAKKKVSQKKKEDNADFNIGVSLFRSKQFKSAETQFNKVAKLSAGTEWADKSYFYISRICATNKDFKKAVNNLNNVSLQKSKAALMKIRYLLADGKEDDAVRGFVSMAELYKSSDAFFTAANVIVPVFIKKKISSEFVKLTEPLLKSKQKNRPFLFFALAQAYEMDESIRNIRLAYSYYNQIVKNYPDSSFFKKAKEKLKYLHDNFLDIK